ncbi:MAG: penicillin acylase family protein [Halobacteriota archaeon]
MTHDRTRRGLIAAIVGGVAAGGVLSPVRSYLRGFAPLSGTAWDESRPDRTHHSGPYGPATVKTDEYGVPHVEADSAKAAYYAIGYVQAADRLFQLELQRRQMRGQLSAVVGPEPLDSDEFYVRMAFDAAADATWEHIADTRSGELIEAYTDGVNARIDGGTLPMEFGLLGFEPDPWTPADTLLMEKQIAWGLTGSFRTLRKRRAIEALGPEAAEELYPDRLDHDAPILRDGMADSEADRRAVGSTAHPPTESATVTAADAQSDRIDDSDPSLIEWLSRFESPPGIGSNSWVVAGEYTASGEPIVANDPHLLLQAPPIWYEQHVNTPEANVRGVTFPGVPFIVIGANHAGAWGFTNLGADVIDVYTYDTDDSGDRYRYRGEWREFETEERRIRVDGAADRILTRKRTVHGPMVERHGSEVAVAWTGHAGTRTTEAIYEYSTSEGIDDVLAATRKFDLPTQSLVYADADGHTMYYATGRVPIRRTDGETVPGNRVFDGSAGEGEWEGFEPFGAPSWDGFIPFEEMPHAIDPDYVVTANQRAIDDDSYPYYLAESYAAPYRGRRVYELLEDRIESGDPIDPAFVERMQCDTYDGRVEQFIPLLAAAVDGADGELAAAIETLESWDGRMDRESTGALLFEYTIAAYRELLFDDVLAEIGLDGAYPNDWAIAALDPESRWFEETAREELLSKALGVAIDRIDSEGVATYGDVNTTASITHPFGLAFLNYPSYPTDGSPATVMNYRRDAVAGSSWRMIYSPDGTARAIAPGGNSGRYFSDHYHDQLRMWADGEYKSMSLDGRGTVRFEFGGGT